MNKTLENLNNSLADKSEGLMEFLISPVYMMIHTIGVFFAAHFDILSRQGSETVSFFTLFIEYGISSFICYLGFMFVLHIISDWNLVEE